MKEECENLRSFYECLCAESSLRVPVSGITQQSQFPKNDDNFDDLSEDEYPCAPNKKRRFFIYCFVLFFSQNIAVDFKKILPTLLPFLLQRSCMLLNLFIHIPTFSKVRNRSNLINRKASFEVCIFSLFQFL